jgi:hypothetical protein
MPSPLRPPKDQAAFHYGLGSADSALPIAKSIRAAENAVNKWCQHQKLAA